MTREETIKWFGNSILKNCSECPKEYDHSCSYANSFRCEAYMFARSSNPNDMYVFSTNEAVGLMYCSL